MLGGRIERKEGNKEKDATTHTKNGSYRRRYGAHYASSKQPLNFYRRSGFFSELIFRISSTAEACLFAYHYHGHRAVSTGPVDHSEGNLCSPKDYVKHTMSLRSEDTSTTSD